MSAALPVRPGTAEQLARVAHFAAVEPHQPDELDYVALWILGDVGHGPAKWDLWEALRGDCLRLWSLIADDWDDDDLDPLTAAEADLPAGLGLDAAADRTRERLITQIEDAIFRARCVAADLAAGRAA